MLAERWSMNADAEQRGLLVLRCRFGPDFAQLGWVRDVIEDRFGRKFDRLWSRGQVRS